MNKLFSRHILARCADYFAVAVAIALPWSTTGTAVFVVFWLVTLVGSWNVVERCRERWIPAGYLPVLFWALGVAGMLWATVPLAERFAGLSAFYKLLAIPFFAIQFRDSPRGMWVLIAFLISCTVMLVVSWALILLPDLSWRGRQRLEGDQIMIGVPVKDYNSQSTMLTLCALGLAEGARFAWHKGYRRVVLALVLLAIAFSANVLYAATSRTALVALSILLLSFAFRRLDWKTAGALLMAIFVLLALVWSTSPRLRGRVTSLVDEVRIYRTSAILTSAGERLEFWRKSVLIIADAPLLGHGTGSIQQQFRQSAAGQTGMAELVTADPHNQIFATAIQLGVIGSIVLLAIWIAHLRFFLDPGLPAGIGLAVVVQNIVSSQFNSSLFDSTPGWLYVVGVGVLSGMTLRGLGRRRAREYWRPVWPDHPIHR